MRVQITFGLSVEIDNECVDIAYGVERKVNVPRDEIEVSESVTGDDYIESGESVLITCVDIPKAILRTGDVAADLMAFHLERFEFEDKPREVFVELCDNHGVMVGVDLREFSRYLQQRIIRAVHEELTDADAATS